MLAFNQQAIERQLIAAFNKRQKLLTITNSMRLVNGQGDALKGLIIDRYDTHVVIYVYDNSWHKQLEVITKSLLKHFPLTYIIVKDRCDNAASNHKAIITRVVYEKSLSKVIVQEYGLKFIVDVNDGLNAGLFLDMRHMRHELGEKCRDKRVLNAFSYTASFGVHARRHGAREVVNVDISKNYIKRGRENYALNGFDDSHDFICFDACLFLEKAVKKQNIFDVIIIDPPSFARVENRTFQVKRDLPLMIKQALRALSEEGILLVSTNNSDIRHEDLEGMLNQALDGRKLQFSKRFGQDSDFVGTNTFKESYLVGLLVQKRDEQRIKE